jgi:branched-chain amino acid aminotransferase
MAGEKPRLLFMNGKIIPYDDARVHVLSTAFKYAATIFEGLRAYYDEKADQLYVFRLQEHLERLGHSSLIARIPLLFSAAEMTDALVRLIRENGLRQDCHIRISAFVTEDDGRLNSTGPVGMLIAAIPMGRYDAVPASEGLSVGVSSWRRIGDDQMPPRVKSVANYHNSRLALLDARAAGFQDTVLLDQRGKVTEGPGYNIFVVRNGKVLTPPVTSGVLEGVTRDTLIRLFAHFHNVEVLERDIDRTELYLADEAFFCGSGKEVTAIGSFDHRPLRNGGIGPWTERIRDNYFAVAKGHHAEFAEWLTPVYDGPRAS